MTAPDQTVNVTDDGIIYEFTMADEVARGGVLIEKRDLESGLLTPLGGASLDGTLFEITNKSVNAVYVGGALYQPGEVCATIEVVDGIAQTDARALPYGTYQMVESKPGEGYLHTDQTVRSFQIREDGAGHRIPGRRRRLQPSGERGLAVRQSWRGQYAPFRQCGFQINLPDNWREPHCDHR